MIGYPIGLMNFFGAFKIVQSRNIELISLRSSGIFNFN
jgi:hypothetical protein